MLTVQVFLMTILIRIMDIMHVLVPDVMLLITITEQPIQVPMPIAVIVMVILSYRVHIHVIHPFRRTLLRDTQYIFIVVDVKPIFPQMIHRIFLPHVICATQAILMAPQNIQSIQLPEAIKYTRNVLIPDAHVRIIAVRKI